MKEPYKKQHIVPKSYLNHFAKQIGEKHVIGVRLKQGDEVKLFSDSTSNVGYVKKYYDVTDKEDPKHWEKYLGNEFDSLCGRSLGNIISSIFLAPNNCVVLKSKEKDILSKIINSQLLRCHINHDYTVEKIYPRVAEQTKKRIIGTIREFAPERLTKELMDKIMAVEMTPMQQKELHFNHSFAPERFNKYCSILQNGVWCAYHNIDSKNIPFFTSDNPVLVENLFSKENGLYKNGLASPSTCIFFPISPSIAIAVYSAQGIFGNIHEELDGKKLFINEPRYVMEKNFRLMDQAFRHSFIPFPFFEQLCSDKTMSLSDSTKE